MAEENGVRRNLKDSDGNSYHGFVDVNGKLVRGPHFAHYRANWEPLPDSSDPLHRGAFYIKRETPSEQRIRSKLLQDLETQRLANEHINNFMEDYEKKRLQKQRLEEQQQQQQKPFPIVLVDIKAAAEKNIIHCVEELSVVGEDLKFVAISYRWGKLNGTTIDTQVGYLATITSFDLQDFYDLCKIITKEKDLQRMKYVWIDAICVDQSNPIKRKTTIHQMTSIYERANYVLAVPDLHLEHLKRADASNTVNIRNAHVFASSIYHLIYNNDNVQLPQLDSEMLHHEDGSLMSVTEKLDCIQKSMHFLWTIMQDWSSRVWVISEYNIAKKRQQTMKYWFIQLGDQQSFEEKQLFFNFSFRHKIAPEPPLHIHNDIKRLALTDDVRSRQYLLDFYPKMCQLLNEQTFLEAILKSKVSRNEDRFNAIIPGSKYKYVIGNKDVVESWKITHLTSVKLKLYEFMNTKDKLELLFLSGNQRSLSHDIGVSPTFATSDIHWPASFERGLNIVDYRKGGNFDLDSMRTITLIQINNNNNSNRNGKYGKYKLNIKPRHYYLYSGLQSERGSMLFLDERPLRKRLNIVENNFTIDTVCVPMDSPRSIIKRPDNPAYCHLGYIFLMGSFKLNRWVLHLHSYSELQSSLGKRRYRVHDCTGHGFDIY